MSQSRTGKKIKQTRGWSAAQTSVAALTLLASALWPVAATAHEIRPAIASLGFEAGGRVELDISLNLEAAIAGIGAGHGDTDESAAAPIYNRLRTLPPDELAAEFARFVPTLRERISLVLDGRAVVFDTARSEIPAAGDTDYPRISLIRLTGLSPGGARTLSWRFDPALGDSVMRLRAAGSEEIVRAEFVAAGQTAGPFPLDGLVPQSWQQVFATYLKLGFVHIVPEGLDHMLFVVGLFLLSRRVSALLWQVSAFTLAHTVTLALGIKGIIAVPPAIVEPLIAASILFIAVENTLTNRLQGWRLPVVFAFGLLHGLGFAGVLGEIGLTQSDFVTGLVAFNLGVELGQIAVIAAAYAAVGWAARRPWYRRAITVPASLAIAAVAGIWVFQRVELI